jgi:Leucine-rich repeat (LRR) protein
MSLERKKDFSFFDFSYNSIASRYAQIKETEKRDTLVDFDFAVAVYPIRDKILARYFTEQNIFEKLWLSQDFVKDYHYQNQTDQPEKISEEDWDTRAKDWDIALEDQCYKYLPSTGSFLFEFITQENCRRFLQSDIWQDEELKQSMIPSFEKRINFHTFEKAYQIRDNEIKELKDKDSSEKRYYISDEEIRGDKVLMDSVRQEVESKLKKELTILDLEKNKISDFIGEDE